MKLITLNLWQGRLFRNYPDFFVNHDADIICLQEGYESSESIPTLELLSSAQSVKDTTGLEHYYFSPVHGYEVMGAKVKIGNCILSRFPILSQRTIFTNGLYREFKHPSEYIGNSRNVQIVELSINNKNLCVVNHHGYWESNPEGPETSLEKIKVITDELRNEKGALIIAGDYNLNSSSKPITYLEKELKVKDLTRERAISSTLSRQVTPYNASCDHIFINNQISVNKFFMSEELLSDHKALVLEFGFNDN